MELIANGVPVFKGFRREFPHCSDEYYKLYATCEGNGGASDRAEPYNTAFSACSFRLHAQGSAIHPVCAFSQQSSTYHVRYYIAAHTVTDINIDSGKRWNSQVSHFATGKALGLSH